MEIQTLVLQLLKNNWATVTKQSLKVTILPPRIVVLPSTYKWGFVCDTPPHRLICLSSESPDVDAALKGYEIFRRHSLAGGVSHWGWTLRFDYTDSLPVPLSAP